MKIRDLSIATPAGHTPDDKVMVADSMGAKRFLSWSNHYFGGRWVIVVK